MISSCIPKLKEPWIHLCRQQEYLGKTGMQFGIDKCAMLVMKKAKIVKSNDIQLPNDKVITSLEEGESYKYLGVLEAGQVMVKERVGTVLQKSKKSVESKVK